MKRGVCGFLIATQSIVAWFVVAETQPHSINERQPPAAFQANTPPLAATGADHTKPAIAAYPRRLDFASVAVGTTNQLTLTVQNTGEGILSGIAKVSAPFRIIGGSPYVLGSSQSQEITLEYAPKSPGLSVTVLLLTGGGGATISVAGLAAPILRPAQAPPAAPASPINLRFVAGR